MIETDPLVRRANDTLAKLASAEASSNPFAILRAKDDVKRVKDELVEEVNKIHALACLRKAQAEPRALFDERPGAAPSLTQSSNAGSSPRGTRVPVTPSGGSTIAPKDFPQSGNYGRPSGSDPFAEERRYADPPPKPENADPAEVERQLANWKIRAKVDPPKEYTAGERKTLAQIGYALPDGSLPIGKEMDLPIAINEWRSGGKSDAGREHIKTRARALGVEHLLPDEFKGAGSAGKLARSTSLRKR